MFNQLSPAIIQFRGLTPYDRYPWFPLMRTYTQQWVHLVYSCNASLLYTEVQLVENTLAEPIFQAGLESKIVALYPFVGATVDAARCPLHDLRGVGPAMNRGSLNSNTGFANSDVGTAVGLQCHKTNSGAYLETNLTPNAVAGTNLFLQNPNPAGLGWYERNGSFDTSFVEPIGCYTESGTISRFSLDLRSNLQAGRWAQPSNNPSVASTAGNSDYYIEASATNLRTLYKDGVSIATNTASDGGSPGSMYSITIGGCRTAAGTVTGYGGRCGVAYMTLGNLGSTSASTLHTILAAFCTAAGR